MTNAQPNLLELDLAPLFELFDCVSPEDVIWSTGRILHRVFGPQRFVYWLGSESTGDLRVFHAEGYGLQVGAPNADHQSLAMTAYQNGFAFGPHTQTDGGEPQFAVATTMGAGTAGGPRFVLELCFEATSSLASVWNVVLPLLEKAYASASKNVENEALRLHTLQINTALRGKLEVRNLELQTSKVDEQKASSTLKQTQEQLVHVQKLASLGQLTAGVAHEINNPLSYANTNAGLVARYWKKIHALLADIAAQHPETVAALKAKHNVNGMISEMDAALSDCAEGMKRVMTIVRDLKAFAHKHQNDDAEVKVHEVLDRTLAIALSPYKHKVRLEKAYCDENLWLCDSQMLSQVVLNLVVNAAQAIPDSGTIRVTTYTEDQQLCIQVSDNGCGISEENRARIFEPFYSTKGTDEGTGLGLSTCLELVKRSDGNISVDSTVGEGTTFTVTLPDRRKGARRPALAVVGVQAAGPKTRANAVLSSRRSNSNLHVVNQ